MSFKWFFLRASTFFLVFSILFELELLMLILIFIFLHAFWGIQSIFYDYIHDNKINYFLNSLLKILLIENITQISIYFF